MQQSLGIIALLVGAGFAQPVFADTYSITLLDGSGPTIDGTGSFTFSAGTFSNFTVIWDALTFDFTSTANATPSEMHGCDGNASISVFTYLTNADCQSGYGVPQIAWEGSSLFGRLVFSPNFNGVEVHNFSPKPPIEQQGTVVITDTSLSTPEPNSVVLMSIALLAVAFVARKRNARGRSPATQTIR